jgi:stress up-regulated protein Nod 19
VILVRRLLALIGTLALTTAALVGATAPAGAAPTASASSQTVTVRYGPFTIPAGSMGSPGEINNNISLVAKPCTACDITGMTPDLVYADGTSANLDTGPMLHHFVLSTLSGQDDTCAGRVGRRLFSSGNERTDKQLPDGYGVRVQPTDRWLLLADLMNHSDAARTVFISITFHYAPLGSTTPTASLWLDVTGCAGASYYSAPAGQSSKSWTWISNRTGRLVFINGHLHDGGQHITAQNLTTGELICDAEATYGQMGDMSTIMEMGRCTGDPVTVIHRGDRIRITSYYDLDQAEPDVMGIMHAYVA